MYGCNSGSIAGVMNGSRFFVLKTRWIKMDDKDWAMRAFYFQAISRFQRFCFCSARKPGALPQAFTCRAFGASDCITVGKRAACKYNCIPRIRSVPNEEREHP